MAGSPDVLSGTFAGRYTIERELGSGATATVYLARDTQRGISVAVKLLRPELAESVGAERFLREIRLNEKLHHPHIVPVLDSGEHDGRLYFVLPHMEDGSLRQMLQREKQLPIETAIAIARTIAQALDYAHQQNLIHRDVKPENILFTSGQACLADFGIARAVERAMDESTTDTGMVRGTPAYMSPEQASGSRQYDGRSDQYSLACVLYEMLAGVPAFIGPTPEAVIAQRFQHQPRELRVYRPTVPESIEVVIQKALALAPADRFASAAEFSTALETASRTPPIERRASGPSVGLTRPKTVALAGTVGLLAILGFALSRVQSFWSDPATRTDSSQVVVFPFRTPAGSGSAAPQELIHAALRRWQPLNVVALSQVSEALTSEGVDSIPSLSEARTVAAGLGAGRFVLGQIVATPTGRSLVAEYRDVSGNTLYSAQVELPTDSSRVRAAYEALTDSLLLRGRSDGSPPNTAKSSRNLYATLALIDAQDAREAWSLERADSLLVRATELDPSLARAQLWLAQIRLWRGLSVPAPAAERAVDAAEDLQPVERQMAEALVAIADGRFREACRVYQEITRVDPRNFSGWYGRGECLRRDNAVVADRRSPSGWRFRHSYQTELDAFTRAFELLPATHRGFQAGAYRRLRALLFTSARTLRRGVSAAPPRREFLASIQQIGDSLALIPFEPESLAAGNPIANADPRAVLRSRDAFHAIVSKWSAGFPNSSAAKEAVAISLEMQADRAALDTIQVAERLANDADQRLRLAASRVLLMVKFGLPDDSAMLRRARHSIDSLISRPTQTPASAALLAPLAALSGRCATVASLLQQAAEPYLNPVRIPADVVGDAYALQALVQLGCSLEQQPLNLNSIAQRVTAPDEARPIVEYRLFGATVASMEVLDSAWVFRLKDMGDYVLAAQADYLSGRAGDALTRLRLAATNRKRVMRGEVPADAVLPEVRLLLQLGDTNTAITILSSVLSEVRDAEPMVAINPANNVSRMAALVQGMALHASLSRDSAEAKRWSSAVLNLWNPSESDHRSLIARMKAIGNR